MRNPAPHWFVWLVGLVACGADDPRLPRETRAVDDPAVPAARTTSQLVCDEPELATSALLFKGNQRVSMDAAPALALEQFTLEAWVRRDERGRATARGGRHVVPLVTRGSDGDFNFAFGFFGDVLAATLDDAAGASHFVQGRTSIPYGEWRHVAATYDGATWRLFVDGHLDVERLVKATPRLAPEQRFGLGAALDRKGSPHGGFHGALDEVRVYARALTAAELSTTMWTTRPNPSGLVAHWSLDAADDDVRDSKGQASGVVTGTSFVTPGAVTDRGAPPAVVDVRQEVTAGSVRLSVDVADADDDEVEVEFWARELTTDDDFSVVVMPDSQYYTRDAAPPDRPAADDPEYFSSQTRWTMDNRAARNIVGLFHVGDIINNADVRAQWGRADAAMSILEASAEALPHGLPYGLSFGNHDQLPRNQPGKTKEANDVFGRARFEDRPYYGDSFDGVTNDENWVSFLAGGLPIIVLSMQFNPTPSPAVLAWARSVFEAHPRALGIVNSHYIVTSGGELSAQGEAIYEALKDVPNVQLMASGHVAMDARLTRTYEGNVIHAMLSDYQRSAPDPADPSKPVRTAQSLTNGGLGYMRLWRFSPSASKLFVETFSPKRNASYTDDRNEFALDVDLEGSGGAFALVSTAVGRAGTFTAELPDADGKVHEWFAVAKDCAHRTKSSLRSTRQRLVATP